MDALLQDLRQAVRVFRQAPAFAAAAVAALAIGIGANTAVFSVINAAILRPLPYPEPERAVMLMIVTPNGAGGGGSYAQFNFWRRQTAIFDDVAAYRYAPVNMTGVDVPEQIQSAHVTENFFRVFGMRIGTGRGFTPDEDRRGGAAVAVISDGLWQRRFAGDPRVIGRTISLSETPYVVVGIVAPGYTTEANPPAEVWVPLRIEPNSIDHAQYVTAVGMLKRGVTVDIANARLRAATEDFRRLHPAAFAPQNAFGVMPMRDALIGNARRSLWVLVGAVVFVLLIACANVANLLLVRASIRRREIAIRASLGAGRARIVRQLLAESAMLAAAGGALGLLIGTVGIRALLAVNAGGIPRIGSQAEYVRLDGRVLAFTVAVSALTAIIFGLIPAFQSSRTDLTTTLKESGGRHGTGFRHNRVRSLLVVSELTLALVLLLGAALLIRSFIALRSVEPGFDGQNVLTLRMSLTEARFQKSEAVDRMVRDGVPRIAGLPGVAAAAATCCVPLEGRLGMPFVIVGRPLEGPSHGAGGWTSVSAGYFDVFRIPLRRGRAFNEQDAAATTPVVVINETMARQLWSAQDPLGERIVIGGGGAFKDPPRQIVGIVGDVRDGLTRDPNPMMYVPLSQVADGLNALNLRVRPIVWVARTNVEPRSLISPISTELRYASGGLPVGIIRTMEEVLARSTAGADFNMLLLTVFGASALLLAVIGLYGLMAYSVQQRTQEIGIRMALGAEAHRVRNMVVAQGMRLTIVGVVIGIVSALALARVMSSLIFGVTATDPIVFMVTPMILVVVALAGVWLPARRAARVDPLIALKAD